MTILDAVKPKGQSPEILFRSGMITHEKYVEMKKKDGRVQ